MTPTISARQRDALYDQIFDRLSGIGDVWLAASTERYEAAERLGREYSDDLRLILDDLGWGEGSGGAIDLTTSPEILRRTFIRLGEAAKGLDAGQRQARDEFRLAQERNQLVMEACRQVLAALEEPQRPPPR